MLFELVFFAGIIFSSRMSLEWINYNFLTFENIKLIYSKDYIDLNLVQKII